MTTTHALGDTIALSGRSLRHVLRSPDTIVSVSVMPIAMLVLFVYVFGGAIDAGPGRYVDYLLPGIVLMTIAMGVSYTAFRLFTDVQAGIFERLRSMPIARPAVLWAHVVTSLASVAISVLLVVAVAVAMGFRSSAGLGGWLLVAALWGLFALTLTWIAVIAGLSASTVDGASAFSYPIVFLPFISSAFVPTDTMPAPVRVFAEHQPVTPVVDAIRSLLAGEPAGQDLWLAVGWCVLILVAAYALAMRVHRRRCI